MTFSRRYFLKQGGVAMVGLSAMPAFLQRAVAATPMPAPAINSRRVTTGRTCSASPRSGSDGEPTGGSASAITDPLQAARDV